MRKCSFDFDLLNPGVDECHSVKSHRSESCHSARACQQNCLYTPLAGKFATFSDDDQKMEIPQHSQKSAIGQENEADFLCDPMKCFLCDPMKCKHKHCDGLSGGHCDGHEDFEQKHFHPCHNSDCEMKSLDDQCMK